MLEYLKFWMAQHLASVFMGFAFLFAIFFLALAICAFNEIRRKVLKIIGRGDK